MLHTFLAAVAALLVSVSGAMVSIGHSITQLEDQWPKEITALHAPASLPIAVATSATPAGRNSAQQPTSLASSNDATATGTAASNVPLPNPGRVLGASAQAPLIQRVVETVRSLPGVTAADLIALEARLNLRISTIVSPPAFPQEIAANGNGGGYFAAPAATQRIDQLNNVTITNPTIVGGSLNGTTGASGGSFGDNATTTTFFSSVGHFATGIIDALTATAATIANLGTTELVATNATTTNLNVSGTTRLGTSTGVLRSTAGVVSTVTNGSDGQVLKIVGGVPAWGTDVSGSGGGASAWATTTDNLAVYTTDPTQVVLVGAGATTTVGNILEVKGNSLLRGNQTTQGAVTASSFTATSSATSTFAGGLSTLNFAQTGSATSTGNNGWNIAAGCYAIANQCLSFSTLVGLLNLSTQVTGTLGVANGGTGSTTLSGLLKGNGTSLIATAIGGADYELPLTFNSPFSRVGNSISLSTSGDWSGTLSGFTPAQLISLGFSTTSADAWKSARNFYSTTSADFWLTQKTTDNLAQGSANRYYSTALFAADLTGTTTDALAEGSSRLYWTNTRFDNRLSATTSLPNIITLANLSLPATQLISFGVPFYQFFSATTTTALAEGANLYFTNARADARVATGIAGTTTDALAEGTNNKYFTNARADARINGTSTIGTLISAPNLVTIATSLSGFVKAASGALSTALVNLTSDVAGILPVGNGGTGWASIAAGAVPYGNGSSALATTSAGANGQVLALVNGVPSWVATTTLSTISGTLGAGGGGTGISNPSAGGILLGSYGGGSWQQLATSSLGLPTFSDLSNYALTSQLFAYLFPGNATTTQLTFSAGLLSLASTTIGNGTAAGGLTINGGATTTGIAYFGSGVGIGTTSPYSALSVVGTTTSTGGFNVDGTTNLLSYLGSTTISVGGTNNFFAGLQANGSTTKANGSDNVFIGNSAGFAVTGGQNVYIGSGSGIGSTTGASNNANGNTAAGYQTLQFNSTGSTNSAFGANALRSNTVGQSNSAFGSSALTSNTTGINNNAFGVAVLQVNTTGGGNSAFGNSALSANTSGASNSAFGSSALTSNTTGGSNSAFGTNALQNNQTGTNNVAVGATALLLQTAGSNNTAMGYRAGRTITTGYSNTLVGDNTTLTNIITTGFGNVGLGSNIFFADPTANRQLNIGNILFGTLPATTTAFTLPTSGTIGVGTSSPWALLSVHANNGSTNTTLFAIGSSTALATTTLFSISNTGAITSSGTGTSTFSGALSLLNFAQTGSATSTGNNGWNITAGCYAINNACLSFSSLAGLINLSSQVTGTLGVGNGGTGISNPSAGGILLGSYGGGGGGWQQVATSSLGLPTFSDLSNYALTSQLFAYLFPGNATSTQLTFSAGLLSLASTTIGSGLQTAGLTISGGATTTGTAYFGSSVGIGTTSPYRTLSIVGTTTSTGGFNVDGNTNLLSYLGSTTISVAGTRNFFAGFQANGSTTKANGTDNVFIGNQAGYAVTGGINIFIGSQSGQGPATGAPNTGAANTAVGYQSLKLNSSGSLNSAFGTIALSSNTTGGSNSAFGYNALSSNTTGGFNSAFGYNSLSGNTTGSNNIAIGASAFNLNYSGDRSIAIGTLALAGVNATDTVAVGFQAGDPGKNINMLGGTFLGSYSGGTGVLANGANYNTFIGYQSGSVVTSGYGNTLLGASQDAGNLSSGGNNIGIGNNIFFQSATANRQLNIGNILFGALPATSTGWTLPASGTIGIGTTSATSKFGIAANNGDTLTTLFQISSSTANSTTTLFSISNTGAITSGSTGTSTFSGSLSLLNFAQTGSATSTGNNGWNITAGCYAINNNCLSFSTLAGQINLSSQVTGTLGVGNGGTGISNPSAGGILLGSYGGGGWQQVATSSLGLPTFSDLSNYALTSQLFAYLFPGNATSTQLTFSAGLLSLASTTIGNGTQAGGLTISGGATTTGPAYFSGNVVRIGSASNSQIQFLNFTSFGNNSSWIDIPTTGSSGIGSGGAGNNAWIAYAIAPGAWFTDSAAGDIAYRNLSGKLLFGNSSNNAAVAIANNRLGVGTTSPFAQLAVHANNDDTNTTLFAIASSTANSTTTLFNISNTGFVGMGTTSPAQRLSVVGGMYLAGSLYASSTVQFSNFGAGTMQTDANGNLSVSSDERLKNIQGQFSRGLEEVTKLSPIFYKWKPETGYDASTTYAGFSAQNVRSAIPEAVGEDKRGYLTLQDRPLIAALVNAIKAIASVTGAFRDTLVAWLADATNGIGDVFARAFHAKDEICINQTCVNEEQLKTLLAASGAATSASSPPPAATLVVNGNDPATWPLGQAWNDNLGALFSHDGAAETIYSTSTVDTSAAGTSTIDYWAVVPATQQWLRAARAIVVSAPANDNTPSAANDNLPITDLAATGTGSTTTIQ